MCGRAKVFVIDDDEAVRASLSRLLLSVGLGVESFASAEAFLKRLSKVSAPACILLDVRMPGLSGPRLQDELNQLGVRIPVIFITGYGDVSTSVRAMKSGATDFLEKPLNHEELISAVHLALDRSRQWQTEQAARDELRQHFAALTRREREVFALVVAGMLNKQIAMRLGVSEKTIKVHRGRMMRKMQAQSVADLVRMAVKLGVSAQVT